MFLREWFLQNNNKNMCVGVGTIRSSSIFVCV